MHPAVHTLPQMEKGDKKPLTEVKAVSLCKEYASQSWHLEEHISATSIRGMKGKESEGLVQIGAKISKALRETNTVPYMNSLDSRNIECVITKENLKEWSMFNISIENTNI